MRGVTPMMFHSEKSDLEVEKPHPGKTQKLKIVAKEMA